MVVTSSPRHSDEIHGILLGAADTPCPISDNSILRESKAWLLASCFSTRSLFVLVLCVTTATLPTEENPLFSFKIYSGFTY